MQTKIMQTNLSQTQLLFREAMSVCAAGVHVITTDGATGRFGITMTAVSSVTDEPPTLMLCVNRQAQIYPILQANGVLCVNVLSSQQIDVAEHFAGLTKLTPEARFEQHIWHRGKMGSCKLMGLWRICMVKLWQIMKLAHMAYFMCKLMKSRSIRILTMLWCIFAAHLAHLSVDGRFQAA